MASIVIKLLRMAPGLGGTFIACPLMLMARMSAIFFRERLNGLKLIGCAGSVGGALTVICREDGSGLPAGGYGSRSGRKGAFHPFRSLHRGFVHYIRQQCFSRSR